MWYLEPIVYSVISTSIPLPRLLVVTVVVAGSWVLEVETGVGLPDSRSCRSRNRMVIIALVVNGYFVKFYTI